MHVEENVIQTITTIKNEIFGGKRSLFHDFSMRVWISAVFYVGKTMHFYKVYRLEL